jgi:hypothetical protein
VSDPDGVFPLGGAIWEIIAVRGMKRYAFNPLMRQAHALLSPELRRPPAIRMGIFREHGHGTPGINWKKGVKRQPIGVSQHEWIETDSRTLHRYLGR